MPFLPALRLVAGKKPSVDDIYPRLFDAILEDADVRTQKVRVIMGPALPVLNANTTLEDIASKLGNGSPAVLVQMPNGLGILTKQDIIGKLK